jgi:hypothetical protein
MHLTLWGGEGVIFSLCPFKEIIHTYLQIQNLIFNKCLNHMLSEALYMRINYNTLLNIFFLIDKVTK